MKTVNPLPAILYIEDDPASKKLLQAVVNNYTDVQLITAWSAEEGLKQADEHLPALVFLDINLPCMCGNEAINHLQKNPKLANTRFYALSADAFPDSIDRALKNGFHGYITKPVDLNIITRIIDDIFCTQPFSQQP